MIRYIIEFCARAIDYKIEIQLTNITFPYATDTTTIASNNSQKRSALLLA